MSAPNPAELQRRIVDCAARARAVDVRPFELGESGDFETGLVGPVVELLESAIALFQEVLAAYDPDGDAPPETESAFRSEPPPSPVVHVVVEALLCRRDHERQAADVAFLGITELRQKLDRVRRLPVNADRWEAVAESGSALRRILRSLAALERAICRLGGLEPQLGHPTQLAASLEVRRQYRRLRQACEVTPTDETLERSLRRVGIAIAVLIGKTIYPELRVHDRRQLRELQSRILTWLKENARDAARLREGHRLWQDILGFTRLIDNVSRRQELVEHDAKVLARAREAIERGATELDRELLEQLETLIGLDAELDDLIESRARDASAWRPVVVRLGRERPALAHDGGPLAAPLPSIPSPLPRPGSAADRSYST